MYGAFPKLLNAYGEIKQFQFYLVEFRTIENEGRAKALKEGVIFDLQSHLISIVQELFLSEPWVACQLPNGQRVTEVSLHINQVARARYIKCEILPDGAETFAAVDVTITVYHENGNIHDIRGLLVVGKGIKPTQSVEADVKGMRFEFALSPRAANFADGRVNPPLSDLELIRNETGFYEPIVSCLSQSRPNGDDRLLSFGEARENARGLREAIRLGRSNLSPYVRQVSTLREVLARCVSDGNLDKRWLPKEEFVDIGYTN